MGTDVLLDTWVDYPLYQVLERFEVSLEEDSGTPGPRWWRGLVSEIFCVQE